MQKGVMSFVLRDMIMCMNTFSPMKPRIRVFSDRIEFFNPGALPKPYEELRRGDISLPRNPILTKIFRVIKLAENAGYGFDKMFDGWASHYSQEPIVECGVDYYKITFPLGKGKGMEKTGGGSQKSSQKGSQKSSQKIIGYMKNEPQITIEQLAQRLEISDRAVKKNIAQLKQKGIIKRIGPDKGGHWKVKAENH